jgi:hypothetical protein
MGWCGPCVEAHPAYAAPRRDLPILIQKDEVENGDMVFTTGYWRRSHYAKHAVHAPLKAA